MESELTWCMTSSAWKLETWRSDPARGLPTVAYTVGVLCNTSDGLVATTKGDLTVKSLAR